MAVDSTVTSTHRPRIALVVHDIASYGGMDCALTQLVRRTSDRYRFVVVSATLDPELRPLVEWRRVPVPRRPIPLKFLAFFVLGGLRLARERVDLICTVGAIVPNRSDVVSVHFCHAGLRAGTGRLAPADAPLPRRLNTTTSTILALVAERWCYRSERTRILAAVSQGLAEELQWSYPGVPVTVAPNGVDIKRFAPAEKARTMTRSEILHASPTDVIALFVGGDWERKGLAVAIAAVARARALGARNLSLVVVGSGDRERYTELAKSHGLAREVAFLGPRADTERLYQASDIFVLPSEYEALPLVALEALAAGLPIVGTPVNGVRELFDEQRPGILVERTPESVGMALAKLAADPELRDRMSVAGREIAQEFTWEKSVDATSHVFSAVLIDGTSATNDEAIAMQEAG